MMTALPAPADPDDARHRQLLQAVAGGDRVALAALYRGQHRRLSRFLRRLTRRDDLIDEVVNDTLWTVWRRAADFRGESRVETWVTGIAYRCMLKALRQGRVAGDRLVEPLDDDAVAGLAGSHDPGPDREAGDWLAHGLQTLPDEQRITLELAYGLGHTCEEIAAIMGCAVGTVKARMFHARVRLRNVLPALGGQAGCTG